MERRTTDSQEHIDEGQDRADAIIGADDTGMLAEQRAVIETEIAEEIE